jgi:hypothetical protein
LGQKSCKDCIYLAEAKGEGKIDFVCVNKEDFVGRLRLVETNGLCRNFQSKPVIDRPTVKQPKNGNIRFIPLTKGKIAIVDLEDYAWLNKYKWYATYSDGRYYAYRRFNKKSMSMHRYIMNAPKDKVVDHKDGNGLNNRRSNLRICAIRENVLNRRGRYKTSKYKGVHWNKKVSKWVSSITERGKYKFLGHFDNEVEAAKAYDKQAAKLFGEFAYLNFPDDVDCGKEKGL